jgi:hypothetical protein
MWTHLQNGLKGFGGRASGPEPSPLSKTIPIAEPYSLQNPCTIHSVQEVLHGAEGVHKGAEQEQPTATPPSLHSLQGGKRPPTFFSE